MSGTAFLYAFLIALAVGVLSALFEFGNSGNGEAKPITVGVIVMVIDFFLNWLIIYFGTPDFSFWSINGWPILVFTGLVISLGAEAVHGMINNSWGGALASLLTTCAILVVWILVIGVFTTPAVCDNEGYQNMIGVLDPQEQTAAYPPTDLQSLIRVPEDVALSDASRILSGGANGSLGSYLAPNRAYAQMIQGHPYYVVDLKVTSWRAFQTEGGVIPGYILVDASDPTAEPQFKTGYQIRYAPGAGWSNELYRRAYMDFQLGSQYQLADLDGMEVDDNFVPHYVGTVLAYKVGFQGLSPVGLYDFDPQTGVGKYLPMSEKPSWLERVYPLDWFNTYITFWGDYHAHQACKWQDQAGQEMVDRTNVVTANKDIQYQFTMTSVGDDPSLTHIITVNPTSGQADVYVYSGVTLQGIAQKVELESKQLNAQGYVADECQLHHILNRDVAYCILTNTPVASTCDSSSSSCASSDTEAEANVTVEGYAFVDVEGLKNGQSSASIAVATDFNSAYDKFQQLMATADYTAGVANNQASVQVVGKVVSNRQVAYPSTQNWSFLIGIQKSDGSEVYVLATGNSLNAAAAIEGTNVTVTAYQVPGQVYYNVIHLVVTGVPDMDK